MSANPYSQWTPAQRDAYRLSLLPAAPIASGLVPLTLGREFDDDAPADDSAE